MNRKIVHLVVVFLAIMTIGLAGCAGSQKAKQAYMATELAVTKALGQYHYYYSFGTPEQQAEWDIKFNPMIVELDKLLDTWNLAVHTDDFSTVDLERILEIKNELILFVHDRLQERSQ